MPAENASEEEPAPAEEKPAAEDIMEVAAGPVQPPSPFMKADRCHCFDDCQNADLVIINSQHATRLSMYHNWKDLTMALPSALNNCLMPDSSETAKLKSKSSAMEN